MQFPILDIVILFPQKRCVIRMKRSRFLEGRAINSAASRFRAAHAQLVIIWNATAKLLVSFI